MADRPFPSISIMNDAVPAIGFGTWEFTGTPCERGVADALDIGYRHLDTARLYENEREVGRGMAASDVDREDIFLTSKIAGDDLEPDRVPTAVQQSLRDLQTDYLDLLLIHWPNDAVPLERTLEAMNDVQSRGMIRHVGVSNFTPDHLREARRHATIFCNQCEYHPFLAQNHLLADAREHGMLFTAYCPLARGRVMEDPAIDRIARRHEVTPAQVALRWLLQQDVAAIPKAASPEHRRANLDILDFSLDQRDMASLAELAGEDRIIDPKWAPDWDREQVRAE